MAKTPPPRPIVSEQEKTPYQRTSEARSRLYELIVHFRREARQSTDPKAKAVSEFAAEVLAGVARAFRQYDDEEEE